MRPSHRPPGSGPKGQRQADQPQYGDSATPQSRAERIELEALAAKIEFYRREAQRLLGLAASAAFDDAKRQFLALAHQYETLAEHAAEKAHRLRST